MNVRLRITSNECSLEEISVHLARCDLAFHFPLSQRVDISSYSAKIRERATTIEAWHGAELVGLVAYYKNAEEGEYYISNVSVLPEQAGQGIATILMGALMSQAAHARVASIKLEVAAQSRAAVSLYRKFGFARLEEREGMLTMEYRRSCADESGGERLI